MIEPVKLQLNRVGLMEMIKQHKSNIDVAVEIGTYKGDFAKVMYDTLQPDFLYAVDPFRVMDGYTDNPSGGKIDFSSNVALDELANTVAEKVAGFGRTRLLRATSIDAALRFEDESLDLVYIDGCHKYASVKRDIETWYPKIKSGYILAGHDYAIGARTERFGVIEAVQEFVKANDLRFAITTKDNFNSWVICKDNKDLFF